MAGRVVGYPDNDQLLEDKRVLLNAIQFSTGQRAFEAELILGAPLDSLPDTERAYLAVQTYSLEMLGTEDFVGWHLVLRNWKPGTVEGSLIHLLDHVDVKPTQEADLKAALDAMGPDDYRRMVHVPTTAEMEAAGMDPTIVAAVDRAIPAQLEGARGILGLRTSDGRGRVVAYNKVKHVLGGIHRPEEQDIFIPGRLRIEDDGLHLQSVMISTSAENIRLMAGRALATQAVLNSTLGAIVMGRYGAPYVTPDWARRAADMGVWRDG
ncbi:MAG: hypothetical protein HYX53_03315 [Chloroflexi bacterium]|nr:hypothetical protein [Chloroflexota bacterium]